MLAACQVCDRMTNQTRSGSPGAQLSGGTGVGPTFVVPDTYQEGEYKTTSTKLGM